MNKYKTVFKNKKSFYIIYIGLFTLCALFMRKIVKTKSYFIFYQLSSNYVSAKLENPLP